MKNLLCLLLIFGVSSLTAQHTFSLSELEKLCTCSLSDFDTYVLKKGYSLWNKTNDTDLNYLCNYGEEGFRNIMSRTKIPPVDVNPPVTFLTYDKDYYANTKGALSSIGYKADKTIFTDINGVKTPVYYYSNGKYTAMFTAAMDLKGNALYSIQIHKN